MSGHEVARAFARDVAAAFGRRPKEIPPRWFYDDLGSALFEAICELPWYPITRAEMGLLPRAAEELTALLPRPLTLLELGSGSGEKLSVVAEAAVRRGGVSVHLVDLSDAALEMSARAVAALGIDAVKHRLPFEEGLRAAAARRREGPLLVLFLGSNIGNLDLAEAGAFLRGLRGTLCPGDGLLLGVDLVKPEAELVLAYDDPLGITAAFNKNLLVRMNRELGSAFELADFEHRALWNPTESRVEMHLVARRPLEVPVPGADVVARFDAGESLFTESSYKYELQEVKGLLERAGFRPGVKWVDETARFALLFARA